MKRESGFFKRLRHYQIGANVQVSYDGSVQSAAIGVADQSILVRLIATTACHINVAANPTAATTDMMLAANVPEYFIIAGASKIAAIKASSAGVLNITVMT